MDQAYASESVDGTKKSWSRFWQSFQCATECKPFCAGKDHHDTFDGAVHSFYLHDDTECKSEDKANSWPVKDESLLVERAEIMVEAAGATYKGQWLGSVWHGHGKLSRIDGSWYEGAFVDGRAHGRGKFIAANGNTYEGDWNQDRAHGSGRYVHEDGSVYEGEWYQDEKCGRGKELWTDGSRYEGQFFRGAKHGFGTHMSKTDEVVFQGQFVNDKMDGDGTYVFSGGRTYVGRWSVGHMHGSGVMQWANGSRYEGQFHMDLRHGEGTLTWPSGRSYRGQWVDGKQDGLGTLINTLNGFEKTSWWTAGVEVQENAESTVPSEASEPAPRATSAQSRPRDAELASAEESRTTPRAMGPTLSDASRAKTSPEEKLAAPAPKVASLAEGETKPAAKPRPKAPPRDAAEVGPATPAKPKVKPRVPPIKGHSGDVDVTFPKPPRAAGMANFASEDSAQAEPAEPRKSKTKAVPKANSRVFVEDDRQGALAEPTRPKAKGGPKPLKTMTSESLDGAEGGPKPQKASTLESLDGVEKRVRPKAKVVRKPGEGG